VKVAVPVHITSEMSAHFGRSHAFLVIEVSDGRVLKRETRINDQAGLGEGWHDAHHHHDHAHPHDHNRFVRLLGDCQAVICLGMGMGARQSLESAGITVRLLRNPCAPEEAALQFEAGTLEPGPQTCCGAGGNQLPTDR